MKVIILLGDGMSDEPNADLGGKTPLQVAATPNMDKMAQSGQVGLARTVPDGLPPAATWPISRCLGTTLVIAIPVAHLWRRSVWGCRWGLTMWPSG